MSQPIVVRITGDNSQFKQQIDDAARYAKQQFESAFQSAAAAGQQAGQKINSAMKSGNAGVAELRDGVNLLKSAFNGLIGIGFIAAFKELASAALQSAGNIDKSRQTLIALTGSVEIANKKLAELRKLAAESPGLTVSLATSAFGQLKAIGGIADETINRLLKGIGKLNAVFSISDTKTFIRNLTQLFTEGFQRKDIKEALGQVPIFNQLLQEAFGTSDPAKLRALKAAGKLTIDTFISGFAGGVENDPRLKSIQESLPALFEKAKDNILVALAPLGDEIAKILLPILQDLENVARRVADGASKSLRDNQNEIKALIQQVENLIGTIDKIGASAKSNGGDLTGMLEEAQQFIGLLNVGLNFFYDLLTHPPSQTFVPVLKAEVAELALFIETKIAGALAKVGIKFEFLTNSIENLKNKLPGLAQTALSGLPNTNAAIDEAERIQRDLELNNRFKNASKEEQLRIARRTGDLEQLGIALRKEVKEKPAFTPPAGADAGGDKNGESKARALRDARLQFERSLAENQIQLAQDAGKRQNDILRASYDKDIISTQEYYDKRLAIARSVSFQEIALLNKEIQETRDTLSASKAGTTERLRLQGVLDDLQTKRILKIRELGDAERESIDGVIKKEKELNETRRKFRLEIADAEIKLSQDAGKRQVDALQRQYGQGIISATDFYKQKSDITQSALKQDLDTLQREVESTLEAISKVQPYSDAQIKLGEKLLDLQTKITVKKRDQADIDRQSAIDINRATIDDAKRRSQISGAQLGEQEARIQNQINLGILSESEGRRRILSLQRQQRDARISALEVERQTSTDPLRQAQIGQEIEQLRLMGVELNNVQRFMKGFGDATQTVGDAFERLGQNVAHAFSSTKGLLENLKNALKQFFNDVLGQALQNSIRSVFGTIFGGGRQTGGGGNAGGGGAAGGGGGGLGGILGGLGNIFRTPTFNPNGGGGAVGVSIGGGGGSVSVGGINIPLPDLGADVPSATGGATRPRRATGLGGIFGNLGNLGSIFKGIGFGKKGAAGSLAGALPLLGLGLGAQLGGGGIGSIIGGAGGALLGVGLTAAPAGLAAASPFLAGLFSNPVTAAIGGALLVGSFLVGRARQRRADERTSGDYLQQAIDSVFRLGEDVRSDRVDGVDAQRIFESEILATFQQQIGTLKTKSVKQSRLTNQVNDLRKLYNDVVAPAANSQGTRRSNFERQIPEFATGGTTLGGPAFLHYGEKILNQRQQAALISRTGPGIFEAIGVPGARGDTAFAAGGTYSRTNASFDAPIVINVEFGYVMGEGEASKIVMRGAKTSDGRTAIVNAQITAQRNREV